MKKLHPLLQQHLTKKWVLCIISGVVLIGFFSLPVYRTWLQDKVIDNAKDFTREASNLNIEYRMQNRFDSVYIYSKQIETQLLQKHAKSALVLVPPGGYFHQYGINYHVPEPAVFYYFTGVKTVWYNCSDAADAAWIVKPVNGRLVIDSVTSKQTLRDSIAVYKKYKIEL